MTDLFEYDVFISFSSADEEIVKPIWQELCSSGLRVFWSDSTLKKEIGNSWFEAIEKSLERSRHMLLVCSDNSMNSKWVQREYRAFFDYCYSPNSRRLIPLLTREFLPNKLPLFLRELQVGKISDSKFIQEIIPILGGINIEKLQQELQTLQEQVNLLVAENMTLNNNAKTRSNKVDEMIINENTLLRKQLADINEQNDFLNYKIEFFQDKIKFLAEKYPNDLLDSVDLNIKIKKITGTPKGTAITLPIKGALSRFIKIANEQTLDESAENYLKYGINFLKKSNFDDAILEFVKVFLKSSPDEKTYRKAKEQLQKMGFTNDDMDFG